MSTAEIVCMAMMAMHQPSKNVSYSVALQTCSSVFDAALAASDDPFEAAAQAGIESRWNPDAVSSAGAVGPLQVLPQFFKGDHIQAGIRARAAWTRAAKRKWGPGRVHALCMYSMGYPYRGTGCAYARRVLWLGGARCIRPTN